MKKAGRLGLSRHRWSGDFLLKSFKNSDFHALWRDFVTQ
jgi:hypothetical protein